MSLQVRFLPVAEAEYRDAVDYYNGEVGGLGEEFREEVIATVRRITGFPEAWQKLTARTRRCRLNRFPYGLVYQIQADCILIVAVMHLRREPNYWASRE